MLALQNRSKTVPPFIYTTWSLPNQFPSKPLQKDLCTERKHSKHVEKRTALNQNHRVGGTPNDSKFLATFSIFLVDRLAKKSIYNTYTPFTIAVYVCWFYFTVFVVQHEDACLLLKPQFGWEKKTTTKQKTYAKLLTDTGNINI